MPQGECMGREKRDMVSDGESLAPGKVRARACGRVQMRGVPCEPRPGAQCFPRTFTCDLLAGILTGEGVHPLWVPMGQPTSVTWYQLGRA